MGIMSGIAIALLVVLLLLLLAARKFKRNKFLLILLLTYTVIASLYLVANEVYYHKIARYHFFDPFYQVPQNLYDLPREKAGNEIRILTLGGSTTNNINKNDEVNYPYWLGQILQEEYPDLNIRILNGGMNWNSSKHSLMYYTEHGYHYQPDLVIVMHAFNDLMRSFVPENFALGEYQPDYSHFYGPAINGARLPTLEYFVTHLDWRKLFDGYHAADFAFSEFRSIDPFHKNMTSLARQLELDEIPSIMVTQPSIYEAGSQESTTDLPTISKIMCNSIKDGEKVYPNFSSMGAAMDSFNMVVERITAGNDCLLFKADKVLPRNSDHFSDEIHYSEKGAKLMAHSLALFIKDQGLLEPGI